MTPTRHTRDKILADLSAYPHVLLNVDYEVSTDYETDRVPVAGIEQANAISSEIADGPHKGKHTIAVDLDVPARLVPSSTPGHSHLYIDVPTEWEAYLALLDALLKAGVVESGYVAASETRGFTTLRLPWISKEGTPAHD